MSETTSWGAVSVMSTLGVTDLDVASSYYRELGFEEKWRYPENEETTHIGMSFGEVSVMLSYCSESSIACQNLYFVLTDVASYHNHLKGFLPDIQALVESDYGMRDFSIIDPWGHLLSFGEASGE